MKISGIVNISHNINFRAKTKKKDSVSISKNDEFISSKAEKEAKKRYFKNLADYIFENKKSSQNWKRRWFEKYAKKLDSSSIEASNFEMLAALVKDGVVDKHVFDVMAPGEKIGALVKDDIDRLYEAYNLGIKPIDAFVPVFKTLKDGLDGSKSEIAKGGIYNKTKIGDVFQLESEEYIRIKTGETSSKPLKLTRETYFKLFPPVERYAATQNLIGNCWELSSLNAFLADKTARAQILSLFSQDGEDIIIKFANDSGIRIVSNNEDEAEFETDEKEEEVEPVVFKNANLPEGINPRYYSKGAPGIQMLEYADGIQMLREQYKFAISEFEQGIKESKNREEKEEIIANKKKFEDYFEKYNGNVDIIVNWDTIKCKKYKGEYDFAATEYRVDGSMLDLYNRLGMYNEASELFSEFDKKKLKKALKSSAFFQDNIVIYATNIDVKYKKTGLVPYHAYRIEPLKINSKGEVKSFLLINPWGITEAKMSYDDVLKSCQLISYTKKPEE